MKQIQQYSINLQRFASKVAVALAFAGMLMSTANAASIECTEPALGSLKNYMSISDSSVSACLDSGVGNINGNPATDDFLTGVGSSYSLASKSDSTNPFSIQYAETFKNKSKTTGTWSVDASFWDTNSIGALGFKFGTGNQPDEWFVFQLIQGEFSGNWEFINQGGKGGGLSHMILYTGGISPVPLPGSLVFLATGLLALVAARRKAKMKSA